MPQLKAGSVLGGWTLESYIDAGGNAEVWEAQRGGGEPVALKVLKSRNVDSEPYQRFRQEVLALERIGAVPGVLPILEYDLPERPTGDRRAWLAMPLATPLAEALRECRLRDVVAAIAAVAETLYRLQREHGIHHRDIKPANLYMRDGEPAISDFGLVDLPEGLDLTLVGRPLGPLHFLAYEMLTNAVSADPGPADVYSLAKSLWVLCTDQRWPPPGEQSAANSSTSVGKFRPHRLAIELDRLIERGTRHLPADRPTMDAFAADLRAWLDLDASNPAEQGDTSALWEMLRVAAAPRLTEVQRDANERQCVRAAARRLQELLEPLHAEIRQNFPAAEFNVRPRYLETSLKLDVWGHQIAHEDLRGTVLSGPGRNPVRLVIGVLVMVLEDGLLHYRGMYYLGQTETMGGYIDEWKSDLLAVPCDSLALKNGLAQLTAEMIRQFPEWLQKLNDSLTSVE